MKLTQFTIQPYRIWYEYLKTALNDKDYSNKINQKYYKDWHLKLVKKLTFNKWYQTHKDLFTEEDATKIKVYDGKETPNTVLVEIPINYTVVRIRKEIGKALKGKIAKSQANKRFKIQSNRPLQTAPFDYFLWSYEFKQTTKKTNDEIWELVEKKIIDRQKRYGIEKRISKNINMMKRKRFLAAKHANTSKDNFGKLNRSVLISRNIKKAKNILENVCKGIFPGDYAVS
jgi:hypothetical protein